MRALVIGSGGREHALAWRLAESPSIRRVFCAPGNAGAAFDASCIPCDIRALDEVTALAATLGVDFTIIGPEAPLVAGAVDRFRELGLPVVGPSAEAARLEGSKIYAKQFLLDHGIPTAEAVAVSTEPELDDALDRIGAPAALKADGLAAGKGVVLVHGRQEALAVGRSLLSGERVGAAGRRLLVERLLTGREVSFIVLTDGERVLEFRPTKDHKPVFEDDQGPNTGGMGAYCDDDILSAELRQTIRERIVEPTLHGLRARGLRYSGFLYCGLMLTDDGPQVLEFNVRLGDPETQPLMRSLVGDLGELLASAARGSLDPSLASWSREAAVCVVLASSGYPGKYEKGLLIEGVDGAERTGATVFHAGTLLRQGRLVTAGGRVLGVTALGASRDDAAAAAYAAVDAIHFEGMHYRRDIGRATPETRD